MKTLLQNVVGPDPKQGNFAIIHNIALKWNEKQEETYPEMNL